MGKTLKIDCLFTVSTLCRLSKVAIFGDKKNFTYISTTYRPIFGEWRDEFVIVQMKFARM